MIETPSVFSPPEAKSRPATHPGWIACSCSTKKLGPTFGIAQRSKKNRANAWEKTGVFPVCSRLRISMSTVLVKGVMTELIGFGSALVYRCIATETYIGTASYITPIRSKPYTSVFLDATSFWKIPSRP